MSRFARTVRAAASILSLAFAAMAHAQTPAASASTTSSVPAATPWTVEVHGGFLGGANPGNGTGQVPPYSDTLLSPAGLASPVVSSWFFGDGARWLNAYVSPISVAAKITPLDTPLTTASLRRVRGPSLGVRVTRQWTSRVDLDFAVDTAFDRNLLTTGTATALGSALTSYNSAWRTALGTLPSFSVATQSSIKDDIGRETFATAAVDVVFGAHRLVRYVSVGGGVAINSGTPAVTLTGTTTLAINGLSAQQTDALTILFGERHLQPVGVVGMGLIRYIGGRSGLRVDARAYFRRNPGQTFITTSPSVTGTPPVLDIVNPGPEVLQFSGQAGTPSTLGQALTHAQTFSGAGVYTQLSLSIGYFFRL